MSHAPNKNLNSQQVKKLAEAFKCYFNKQKETQKKC